MKQTLGMLMLIIGSAAPVMIAIMLVASTNDGNPLDKIPDYEDPPTETLTVPFDREETTYTEFQYVGSVRLVIEGIGRLSMGAASNDAFYVYTDAEGNQLETPRIEGPGLIIDGEPAFAAPGIVDQLPVYNDDHLYAAIFDAGPRLRRIAFRVADIDVSDNTGEFTITVVQLKN
jgi:hypothetical protein